MNKLFLFIIYSIGAFFLWAFGGFQRPYDSYIPERGGNFTKSLPALIIWLVVFIFLASSLVYLYEITRETPEDKLRKMIESME